ncbi:MAG: bifunctional methylenetetrahydrofolate dehydrogenase/methenyltetrahydrofolate cyclohydrolase [Myxococcota bacterium]
MTTTIIDPAAVAEAFRDDIRHQVSTFETPPTLLGLLANNDGPSQTYADYTRRACASVGVHFNLRSVPRLEVEEAIREANADPNVHGIMVYYPVFGTGQDTWLRQVVDPAKDIEGLHPFWADCLYGNRRFIDAERSRKAILPCTPLAILKLIDAAGALAPNTPLPLQGQHVCIFNRSEVVGRPLAAMLAHDGAHVTSFDLDGPQLFLPPDNDQRSHTVQECNLTRTQALARADIVITGVPSRAFEPVRAAEIAEGALCINFSSVPNIHDDVLGKAATYIPRVGPMTVTMTLRNTLRLYTNALTTITAP